MLDNQHMAMRCRVPDRFFVSARESGSGEGDDAVSAALSSAEPLVVQLAGS